jgi:hypothetical protein
MTELETMRSDYKNYLMTAEGRNDLQIAVRMKREWKADMCKVCLVHTKNVKLEKIPAFFSEKMEKLEIIPIALNNLCHSNSQLFKKNGYKTQLGFNVTACKCGKDISFEIHTVNKKDGKLYDFTKDFNDEKEKWFYPIPNDSITAHHYISMFGRKYDYLKIDGKCRCYDKYNIIDYGDAVKKMTFDEMEEHINDFKHIRFYG